MNHPFKSFLAVVFICAAGFMPQISAQMNGITVSDGVHISTDGATVPFVESFLAINPMDQRNLIATSMTIENGTINSRVYASRDRGRTWGRAKATSDLDNLFKDTADPVIYFGADGHAFFGAIKESVGLLLSLSLDGGMTWSSPVHLPIYDRGYLGSDESHGKFKGRIYAGGATNFTDSNGKGHGAAMIVYSSDGGHTFSPGRTIAPDWMTGEEFNMISDILVTSEGTLVVPYVTYNRSPQNNVSLPGRLWTVLSEDGGVTFGAAQPGPNHTRKLSEIYRSEAAPRSAIDLSEGLFRDRIYFVWSDFDGNRYLVKVAHSSDLGKTWSEPLVVNDNENEKEPTTPAIAINRDGIVVVAFYDRRNDPNDSCYQLYYAVSLDGGESFLHNIKASEQMTCPLEKGNWVFQAISGGTDIEFSGIPSRWRNGGETQGFTAASDGGFHSAWINGVSGVMQLWSKELIINRNQVVQSESLYSGIDVSDSIKLVASDPRVDFAKHQVSVRVHLVNPTSVAVAGPFVVVLQTIHSCLKEMRIVNSDDGMTAKGASWTFTLGGRSSLEPHQESEEREFLWQFAARSPDELPSGNTPLDAHFSILGRVQ